MASYDPIAEPPKARPDRFEGRAAIVTGGVSGIGLAIVHQLLRDGARVMVADVGEPGDDLVPDGVDAGRVEFQRTDVADQQAQEQLAAACVERFGSVDMLFNNAGITRITALHEMPTEQWDQVLAIDLTAVFLGCRAVLPQMIEQGRGAIVNTASTLGVMAQHKMSSYVAAKHGVVGLTKQIALDYGTKGIRCNAIAPGPTRTPNVARSYGPEEEMGGRGKYLLDTIALGRMAAPHEIAAGAVFLASDEASFISGVLLPVDGAHSVHTGPIWTQELYDEG